MTVSEDTAFDSIIPFICMSESLTRRCLMISGPPGQGINGVVSSSCLVPRGIPLGCAPVSASLTDPHIQRGAQFCALHHPSSRPLHFLPAHRPTLMLDKITSRPRSVASTATTTLTNVILEQRQLNGRARNSHLSRHASGQISADSKGDRIPNGYA